VLDAVHEATRGIPRRINVLCDRLLLLGFMAGRTQLTLEDVKMVVADLAREAEVPASARRVNGHAREMPQGERIGELLPEMVRIDPQTAADALAGLTRAEAEQFAERLQRLERSLLRLERIQLQILSTLKEFTRAARDTAAPEVPPSSPEQTP
jgi:general secretion pathway protein A